MRNDPNLNPNTNLEHQVKFQHQPRLASHRAQTGKGSDRTGVPGISLLPAASQVVDGEAKPEQLAK